MRALPQLATLQLTPGWDYGCAVAAAVGAFIWVKIFDALARSGVIDQKLSRKVVHSTAGPLFMLMWPLFSSSPEARIIAAAVPTLNLIRLALVGSGVVSDPALVKSTSRSGDKGELLRGPLYYVMVLVGATLVFWRDSPAGLIAISMMCGGDGLADIVGRRLGGSNRLPWNGSKSWAGSAAMLLGGAAMGFGFIYLFCGLGFFEAYPPATLVPVVFTVCLVCTLIESLPVNEWVDDNLSVPAAAIGMSMLLLPLSAAAAVGIIAAEAAQAAALPGMPLLSLAQVVR